VPAADGSLVAWLHENTEVLSRDLTEDGSITLTLRIDPAKRGRLQARLHRAGVAIHDRQ